MSGLLGLTAVQELLAGLPDLRQLPGESGVARDREGLEMLRMVGTVLRERHPRTADHCERVATRARDFGATLGLSAQELETLSVAAYVHDAGKVFWPEALLQSQSKQLTAADQTAKLEHPETGDKLLQTLDLPWNIADPVRHHHEKIDGSGYPDGLSNHEVSLPSAIISLADIWDAISEHRPYNQEHFTLDQRLRMMEKLRGKAFDAELTDKFLAFVRQ